ncbi:MAG: response regulator transcription factor [Acidobacteria bacterium]|nr:response regulator transcription factor [Acidobacteriota bacterium]
MTKPKILVIEDDPTMAEMVAYNLRRQDIEVVVATDGGVGLREARDRGVSLVVLDLMLPVMDGLQIARELRTTRPDVPIIMLTARSEDESKLRGFEAGADDYVTKPFGMEELLARVKALLRRSRVHVRTVAPPDAISFGDLRLAVQDQRAWVREEELTLRPKEFALIATLAAEPGKLFTRVELAERLWGYSYLGETRTIDTHVKNLRRKVEDGSAYRYVETVRGAGYRFRVRPKKPACGGDAAR